MWVLCALVLVLMSSHQAHQKEIIKNVESANGQMERPTHGGLIMDQQFATTDKQAENLIRITTYRVNGLNNIAELQVGEPARKFRVLLDSGSGDLWLPSSGCSNVDESITSTFDEKQSSTFDEDGRFIRFKYGNGHEISGQLGRELISFGELKLPNQTFIRVNQMSSNRVLQAFKVDGVLGLGLQSATGYADVQSPLRQMLRLLGQQSGGTNSTKSMLSLSWNHGQDSNRAGELLIGGLDESRYVGPISWTPLVRPNMWEVRLDSIELNFMDEMGALISNELTVCAHGCEALADTGTAIIGGNSRDIRALNERIGAHHRSGGLFVLANCDNVNSRLPHLSVSISGSRFSVKPSDYTYEIQGVCYSALMEVDAGGRWVLGQKFIGHFFVALDYDNNQFGLAKSTYESQV